VRDEFFLDRDTPSTASKPYRMDFTYLYDRRQQDFVKFTAGVRLSEGGVFAEIGRPETWTHRSDSERQTGTRSPEAAAEVAALVQACLARPACEGYAPLD